MHYLAGAGGSPDLTKSIFKISGGRDPDSDREIPPRSTRDDLTFVSRLAAVNYDYRRTQDTCAEHCCPGAALEREAHEREAPVNYAAIFAQSQEEYDDLHGLAHEIGSVVQDTAMGPVFKIQPISTVAGDLHLLKIRRPDPKRAEKGDADFTVTDYAAFKKTCLGKPGFALIERENMEMIELHDPAFSVLAYYSNPTLAEVLRIKI